jgi:hypothetical protein
VRFDKGTKGDGLTPRQAAYMIGEISGTGLADCLLLKAEIIETSVSSFAGANANLRLKG